MSTKTLLVVDDDPGVRNLLNRVLHSLGHHVVEAADALSALEVLASTKVDLALVDVRMPGHDGVWLTDQIISRFPQVPVALATGLTEMDPSVTLRPGVVGYVVKPFRRSELAELVNRAFERKQLPARHRVDLAAAIEAM